MRTFAVLPVKRRDAAKQRLGAALERDARADLALAMATDVIAALCAAEGLEGILVVTADAQTAALAVDHGVEVVGEGTLVGHSAAASLGVDRAVALGAERVLLVPGDCPGLLAEEIDALLKRHRRPGVVIVPDRHASGTNALLIAPPRAIRPAFGEGSCRRHRAIAASAGVACAVDAVPGLTIDVDQPDDIAVLRCDGAPGPTTRAALDHLAAAR